MAVGGEIIPLAGTADDNPWMGVRFSGSLVGRDAELGRLDAALARASRGSSAVVLVGGEAGVGKSRLAAEAADLLAARLGREPDPNLVERVMARSEGNPLFAEELLASELHGGGEALPGSLQDLFDARIEALSDDARQVLRMAATAGRAVRHGLLAAASPLDQPALLVAVREAVAGQVLVVDPAGDGYAFRHALLHEAVEADLLPG
jgi:predicted ATPase